MTIEQVAAGSPADRAKLKVGEVLLKIDDVALTGPDQLNDLIETKTGEGTIVATLRLAEKAVDLKIKLDPEPTSEGRPFATGDGTGPGGQQRGGGGGYWTKPSFRLAIVCVEYPDVKHNPQITNEAWNEALFSEGTYHNKTNVTGQAVHGSFRDYFLEQSCGYFRVEGKVFDWVEVGKKREEYATGNRMALLTESLDKVLARDGKEALKDFDGVFFLYAGARFPAPRGSLYWPHRASVSHQGKRWPYFIVDEGGPRMQGLSVLCHEFGHMLGLPDLYARPENPGMEGLGVWCNMSQQPNRMIPRALRGLGEGEGRLAQAGGHRPDRQAEAGPRADRELAQGMLQGPDPARRLGVPPPGEPPEDRIRPEPPGRRPLDLARPGQPTDVEGVARHRGTSRPSRPPERGAVPQRRQ